MKKNNEAFTSFQFLIIILTLSVLVSAAGIILRSNRLYIQKQIQNKERRQAVESCISDILQVLSSDSSPESDTQQDLFWKLNETELDECKITISSLSSRLDVNFIPPSLFTETGLCNLFISPGSPELMERQKETNGLFFRYNDISDFINEDNFNKYFTTYSWPNFNISDDIAIETFLVHMINESSADSFARKREDFLKNKQTMQSFTEYKLFCGVNFEQVSSFVMLSPVMNVNFMDRDILSEILNYPEFGISGAWDKASRIESTATGSGIQDNDLVNILGVPKTNKIYYYLGTVTWFWEIKVQKENACCTLIVGRYPETDDFSAEIKRFILEKRWE